MTVKLLHGTVIGPGKNGKPGDIVEMDTWTARHLILAERAEEVSAKKEGK